MRPRPFQHRPRVLAALLVIIVLASGVGCDMAPRPAKFDAQVQRPPDINVTQNQTRLRMRSLVGPMCGDVEEAADAIMAGTSDPDVQLAALKWKMDAVPALRVALFQPHPGMAVLDTLVLCNQMIDYFETGAGKQALGPASAQAVATCQRMRDEFIQVVASGTESGDVSKASEFARTWAAEHPMGHSITDRESALTRVFEQEFADSLSAGQAIAEVTTTLDDLNRKLDVYGDQVFRQARWEGERLKRELLRDLRADEALPLVQRAVKSADQAAASLDRLATAMEGVLIVAQDAQRIATSEREAAIGALHEELTNTIQIIREERMKVFEEVGKERILALKGVADTIDQQRKVVTSELDQMTVQKIDYTIEKVTRLVMIGLGAIAVMCLLGLIVFARWIGAVVREQRRPQV